MNDKFKQTETDLSAHGRACLFLWHDKQKLLNVSILKEIYPLKFPGFNNFELRFSKILC